MGIQQKIASKVGSALGGVRSSDAKLAIREADLDGVAPIEIDSPAFANGAPIPTAYSADGDGSSPPLHWGDVPKGTRELVLLCEDPDAPKPSPFVHWVLYGIPPSRHDLPAGDVGASLHEGKNSMLREGWTPPAPPRGHGVHHYHFELFALDRPLSIGEHEGLGAVVEAMRGHVLGKGELVGTYQRA